MRESALLSHIYQANRALPRAVVIPPGDDMGAVVVGGVTLLVTVDQLADGVHFDLGSTPIEKVGRKAITRNLSDVAAMAAQPVGAVAAACLPKGFGEDRAKALFDAMRDTAQAYDCPLIGGDIAMWDQRLILTVTVLAEPGAAGPILRRGACVGDVIYVSGQLGGSMQRLDSRDGYVHHLDFEPRLALAHVLASHPSAAPHAMMDLSDGLAMDLPRLCEASGVRAEIDVARLPISEAAHQAASASGQPAWRHALGDGEDYELCFTAAGEGTYPAQVQGTPITAIGRMVDEGPGPRVGVILPDGSVTGMSGLGWEHTD